MRITTLLSAAALTAGLAVVGAASPAAAQDGGGEVCAEDVKYLVRAHRGNLAEQAAGRAALAESADERVRAIAARLIPDHGHLDLVIVGLAERHGVTLPPKPNQKQRDDLAAVVAKDGAEFDTAWLETQEKAHLMSLEFIGRELRGGCAPAVKGAASAAFGAVAHHLHLVREALKPGE